MEILCNSKSCNALLVENNNMFYIYQTQEANRMCFCHECFNPEHPEQHTVEYELSTLEDSCKVFAKSIDDLFNKSIVICENEILGEYTPIHALKYVLGEFYMKLHLYDEAAILKILAIEKHWHAETILSQTYKYLLQL